MSMWLLDDSEKPPSAPNQQTLNKDTISPRLNARCHQPPGYVCGRRGMKHHPVANKHSINLVSVLMRCSSPLRVQSDLQILEIHRHISIDAEKVKPKASHISRKVQG